MSKFQNTAAFARLMDQKDPLRNYRKLFHIPKHNGKPSIYFTGNSLGLQPVSAATFINEELKDWATLGVDGHFRARRPWVDYHKFSRKGIAAITGALESEVVTMNQLTINLHLMLSTFYRPTRQRFKIIAERGAFSSDQYAFESQIALHGYNPDEALIEVSPREGEHVIHTEDILEVIKQHGDQTMIVIFGAVQYYSGQLFDIKAITSAAHEKGAHAGFDLAHAIGNVPLSLHSDEVDFAVWCSYKYLNAGPGAIAGAFIHEVHGRNKSLPRLAGWWGHLADERFKMEKGFKPMPGADGWQVSNFPVLAGAAQLASLDIFKSAGMKALRKKSVALTGYLEFLLGDMHSNQFEIITPSDPRQRGCQLSILMKENGKKVFNMVQTHGVIADWREPDVIRVAPVPLYNSFADVYRFSQIFKSAL